MDPIDIIIPQSTTGFDVVAFLSRAHYMFLLERVGLIGIREIRDQMEFEQAEGQGNA